MSQRASYTTGHLVARSLTPSPTSLFLFLLTAMALVATNILLQSVDTGTALPGILDGQWAIAYTEHVVQPLTQLLDSNTLNKLLIAAMWGVAGFIIYIGFEYSLHWKRRLSESRTNIRMARGGVIEQPMTRSFWQAVRWRVGVLILGFIFLVMTIPMINNAMGVAGRVLLNNNLLHDALWVALAVAEWTVFSHGVVAFLRLYTQRTRLFGDDKLY